jgi:solute carrier family 10 (sodium/bile acid cotransporter), member 7
MHSIRNPKSQTRNLVIDFFAIIQARWFLLTLILVLLFGIGWPNAARPATQFLPANAIVASVTFIMALPLESSALWMAVRRPGPAWLAAAINSGLAPPLGWLASRFLPDDLVPGVIVATAVPCTLATAAVWTRRAGGNDAVAFLVTMITNLSCFAVVPAWLWLFMGIHTELDYRNIVAGLILFVVVPILVAQALRQSPPIGSQATRHKHLLSRIAQCGVLLMVAVGAVKCGDELQIPNRSSLALLDLASMIACVAAVHLALLMFGAIAARNLGYARGDAIAVAFSGSQKTLMVGAYLAKAVNPLAILPMVAYHATQLIIDTLIADRWRRHDAADLKASNAEILA